MRKKLKLVLVMFTVLGSLIAGQSLFAESRGKVLIIMRPNNPADNPKLNPENPKIIGDYMIIREFGAMKTALMDAGFTVVVATEKGDPVEGQTMSVKPDLKLSDVQAADYKGIMLPCMHSASDPPEAVKIVRDALAKGIPIAAQNGGVFLLSMAGGLKGKKFTIASFFAQNIKEGTYCEDTVVQDGNIVTSSACPFMERYGGKQDTTMEITQKFIALLQ
jgi:putative intracellular protease/amidase